MQANKERRPIVYKRSWILFEWRYRKEKVSVDGAQNEVVHMYDLLAHLNANGNCIEIKLKRWKHRKVILNFNTIAVRQHSASVRLFRFPYLLRFRFRIPTHTHTQRNWARARTYHSWWLTRRYIIFVVCGYSVPNLKLLFVWWAKKNNFIICPNEITWNSNINACKQLTDSERKRHKVWSQL